MCATPKSLEFRAEGGVVAKKLKIFVHFFGLRKNYARYRYYYNEALLGSCVCPF
jgi:hypothetical protein